MWRLVQISKSEQSPENSISGHCFLEWRLIDTGIGKETFNLQLSFMVVLVSCTLVLSQWHHSDSTPVQMVLCPRTRAAQKFPIKTFSFAGKSGVHLSKKMSTESGCSPQNVKWKLKIFCFSVSQQKVEIQKKVFSNLLYPYPVFGQEFSLLWVVILWSNFSCWVNVQVLVAWYIQEVKTRWYGILSGLKLYDHSFPMLGSTASSKSLWLLHSVTSLQRLPTAILVAGAWNHVFVPFLSMQLFP